LLENLHNLGEFNKIVVLVYIWLCCWRHCCWCDV